MLNCCKTSSIFPLERAAKFVTNSQSAGLHGLVQSYGSFLWQDWEQNLFTKDASFINVRDEIQGTKLLWDEGTRVMFEKGNSAICEPKYINRWYNLWHTNYYQIDQLLIDSSLS